MSSYIAHAGTTLYRIPAAGQAAVTLPTGITLAGASTPCRAVLFGANTQFPVVTVVNGGTHDFYIDTNGTARPLAVSAPVSAPVATTGAATGLTGVYTCALSFKIKDPNGMTIFETELGPVSSPGVSLTNKSLRLDNIPVSGNGLVNARGLYRSTAGGSIMYPWFDIDNNTDLFEDRAGADASLSLLAAPANGTPPDFKHIARWKDRLWGIPRQDPDKFRWSEERVFYAWPAVNEGTLPPAQTDTFGGMGFIPRRDALGIPRRDAFYAVTGDSNDTFHRYKISDIGLAASDSVVVNRDVGYFLGWSQGRYVVCSWSEEGVRPLSEARVDAWFNTSTYFSSSQLQYARGRYNPDTDAYELLVSAVGSTNLDRWVSYHIRTGVWYGPHLTNAFIPSCAATNSDAQGVVTTLATGLTDKLAVFGSNDGFLWRRNRDVADDGLVPVPLRLELPYLHGDNADNQHVWLQPSMTSLQQIQGVVSVASVVGEVGDAPGLVQKHDLTAPRNRLKRLGRGRLVHLTLTHEGEGEGCHLNSLELPYTELGKR